MSGNQTTIQQLIQQLTPSGVNNGNPNTAYNNPLPPMQDAQGKWFTNAIGNAANIDPRTLTLPVQSAANVGPAWQAPASLQANLPVWGRPFDLSQYGPPPAAPVATVVPGTGVPATGPVPTQAPTPKEPYGELGTKRDFFADSIAVGGNSGYTYRNEAVDNDIPFFGGSNIDQASLNKGLSALATGDPTQVNYARIQYQSGGLPVRARLERAAAELHGWTLEQARAALRGS